MRFLTLLLCSALAAVTTAATLTPDLPDGIYHAYTDEHGVETHTRLSNDKLSPLTWTHDPRSPTANFTESISANPASLPASLQERNDCSMESNWEIFYCGCGFTLDPHNCDAAVADLKGQVGSVGIYPKVGHAYYTIRTNVVAFICAFNNNAQAESAIVTSQTIGDDLARITQRCGAYVAGSYVPVWNYLFPQTAYDVGYMRYTAGLDFCANARTSGHTCC